MGERKVLSGVSVTLLIVLTIFLSTVSARVYYRPYKRNTERSGDKQTGWLDDIFHTGYEGKEPMKVEVYPKTVTEYGLGHVSVTCSVKDRPVHDGQALEDLPYITFYWQIEPDALVPLSSSVPGVYIEPVDEGSDKGYHVYGQRLNLKRPLLDILRSGMNKFVCKVSNMLGEREEKTFAVNKQVTYYG